MVVSLFCLCFFKFSRDIFYFFKLGSSTLRSSMLTGSRGGNGSRSFDYYGVASPPVGPSHLREYKTAGANATRVNTSVPEMDENFREKNEMIRKRRPRMEATLRGCRDIITDLFSRKHKVSIFRVFTLFCNFVIL